MYLNLKYLELALKILNTYLVFLFPVTNDEANRTKFDEVNLFHPCFQIIPFPLV